MNLENTEKLLLKKAKDKDFDSYAVIVYAKGNEKCLHSPNVNMDTYFDIASMGKVLITSTLILKALSENKISLDDKLNKFFHILPMKKQILQ